ncbi:hypothetical protein ACWDFR_45470, partial [Streptomyces sp. 900105755]
PSSPSSPSAVFSLPPDQADPVSACPPLRGRPLFANNILAPHGHFERLVDLYRQRFAHYGHGTAQQAIIGLGGQVHIAKRSQDAIKSFRAYFNAFPLFRNNSLEEYMELTPLSVGSPQEVIDKTMTFRERFGDYQRQLWNVDGMGLPVGAALEQIELLGAEVVPVLRKEMAALRAPGVPGAPTHASLTKAKYGDAQPRQPRPNPNRGDNLTHVTPYQDGDTAQAARRPQDG